MKKENDIWDIFNNYDEQFENKDKLHLNNKQEFDKNFCEYCDTNFSGKNRLKEHYTLCIQKINSEYTNKLNKQKEEYEKQINEYTQQLILQKEEYEQQIEKIEQKKEIMACGLS